MLENPSIDIQREAIDLLKPKVRTPDIVDHLRIQNRELRKQNKHLQQQLSDFSLRLDEALRKKIRIERRKAPSRGEDIVQMELHNAYKKCEIYKREAQHYKKKMEGYEDFKLEEVEQKCQDLLRENEALKSELKDVKKTIKLQEKGLVELGAEGFLKMNTENEKMKEEIRRLRRQLTDTLPSGESVISNNSRAQGEMRVSVKPVNRFRVKTEVETSEGKDNQSILEFFQAKAEKDDQKMRLLLADKSKLREMLDNTKMQLAEKEKENGYLRDKISCLRKSNQLLHRKEPRLQQGSEEKAPSPDANDRPDKPTTSQTKPERKWESEDSTLKP